MDILNEGFGYMLVLGDLAFVPFMYSLQARFLVSHPVHLSWLAVAAIVMLFGKMLNKSYKKKCKKIVWMTISVHQPSVPHSLCLLFN